MKKNLLKNCIYLLLVSLAVYSCENETIDSQDDVIEKRRGRSVSFDLSQECSTNQSTNLYAGQNILVGEVSVEIEGDNYVITYSLTNSDYCITETHLSVVETPSDFPLNNGGNPKIGHFEYSNSHDCTNEVSYTVSTLEGAYIAAHAVVNCVSDVSSESFALDLPDQVDVCVTEKGVYPSYFDVLIADGNSLSGSYEAWCVDTDLHLENGQCFVGDVYSSYETLPGGAFEQTDNFGAVNWLMNQSLIDSEASAELGNYTFGDIQLAIWSLVDDFVCTDCAATGPFNLERVDLLVSMALEHNNFVPSCGENVVIIIIPTNNLQSIFITIPAPCVSGCSETAWGDGCDFPGNSWATYFHYEAAN